MFYKTYADAFDAAQKLKEQYTNNGIIVKVEKSPYGGFQIRLIQIDLLIDELANRPQNTKARLPFAHC